MINDKSFLEFLNDKSLDLPKEELEQIIEAELEKPENEMDADLIEYCLDALNEIGDRKSIKEAEERKRDSKRINLRKSFNKAFIAAAALAILAVSSLTVYAAVTNVSILDGLVELYNKYIVVRFDKSNNKTDDYELLGTELARDLKENGIYPVLLPEALLGKETQITEIEYQVADGIITANINFYYGEEKGYLTIDCYDSLAFIGESEYPNAQNVIKLDISGISVYVFEQNGKGSIAYKDGKSQYGIFSSMTYEQAIELAKTIK